MPVISLYVLWVRCFYGVNLLVSNTDFIHSSFLIISVSVEILSAAAQLYITVEQACNGSWMTLKVIQGRQNCHCLVSQISRYSLSVYKNLMVVALAIWDIAPFGGGLSSFLMVDLLPSAYLPNWYFLSPPNTKVGKAMQKRNWVI